MANVICNQWPQEPWKCNALKVATKTFASLSLVGSVLLIAFMLLTKKYEKTFQKIVFAVTCTTLLFSVAPLLSKAPLEQSPLCITQGFLMNYSQWLLLLWMLLITLTILFKINRWSSFLSDHFRPVCVFIILSSFAIACLPFINNSYGPTVIWCWMQSKEMQLAGWMIPFLVIMCVVILLYVYIGYSVYRNTNPVPCVTQQGVLARQRSRKEVKKLLIYPVAYLVLYLPIIVLGILKMFVPGTSTTDFVLFIVAFAFFLSSGLVYSLLYLALLTTRQELTIASLRQSWRKLRYGNDFAVDNNVTVAEQTVIENSRRATHQ